MIEKAVTQADITWDEKGLPHSVAFDDKYFCELDGYAESLYAFCGGNQLIERFQKFNSETFVIGETGFGTGLNFLSAWQLFEKHAENNSRLHFVSLEKFPMTVNDLQRSLSIWKNLNREAGELVDQYGRICDSHEGQFLNGRITLTIIFDDVLNALDEMKRRSYAIDAWFLDGFAPSKNPEMWSPDVFKRMAAVSHKGTTLATFTCAGHVRRGLQDAGFQMQKASGFGMKRHMLRGRKN